MICKYKPVTINNLYALFIVIDGSKGELRLIFFFLQFHDENNRLAPLFAVGSPVLEILNTPLN